MSRLKQRHINEYEACIRQLERYIEKNTSVSEEVLNLKKELDHELLLLISYKQAKRIKTVKKEDLQ